MKTNAQHTPGLWHRNIRANGRYPVVFAGRNTHVATVCQQPSPEETEANIDLISTAPELLEALKDCHSILSALPTSEKSPRLPVIMAAKNAIMKAEGRP